MSFTFCKDCCRELFLPQGMLAFRISKQISWSHLFSVMEAMKTNPEAARDETNNATVGKPMVEDYAASDASLEQVFLSFARETVPNHPTLPDSIPYITQL